MATIDPIMKNKTLLSLALAFAATFVSVAHADPSHAPRPAAAASAPSATGPARIAAPAMTLRPATIPQLELKLPPTPGVICACVRAAGRA